MAFLALLAVLLEGDAGVDRETRRMPRVYDNGLAVDNVHLPADVGGECIAHRLDDEIVEVQPEQVGRQCSGWFCRRQHPCSVWTAAPAPDRPRTARFRAGGAIFQERATLGLPDQ